jgi:site-specific recombinase XerD
MNRYIKSFIQKQTSFLFSRQEEIEHRLAVKLKRKNAIKQPIRQTVTIAELQKIIPLIKAKTPYIKARRTVALFILYLTGLRVKNLLTIIVKQLLQLLNQGHTEFN